MSAHDTGLNSTSQATEDRRLARVSLRTVPFWCVLWGIAGPAAQSQERPTPPTPHARPVLPGTHVPPRADDSAG